eukprot:scaffold13209_cov31-Tisochrysis_lutea.AAC.4
MKIAEENGGFYRPPRHPPLPLHTRRGSNCTELAVAPRAAGTIRLFRVRCFMTRDSATPP